MIRPGVIKNPSFRSPEEEDAAIRRVKVNVTSERLLHENEVAPELTIQRAPKALGEGKWVVVFTPAMSRRKTVIIKERPRLEVRTFSSIESAMRFVVNVTKPPIQKPIQVFPLLNQDFELPDLKKWGEENNARKGPVGRR